MRAATTALAGIKRQHPEWLPWLAVLEERLRDNDAAEWNAVVPPAPSSQDATPLLAGAALEVPVRAVRSLLQRLIRVASRSGTPQMTTLSAVLDVDPDLLSLFKGSLCQDRTPAAHTAAACGADARALEAVVGLLALPFLHACHRAWAPSVSTSWLEGYCPVCGAWPAFAESRGIERNRFFRCGRCGGAWHARPLRCPYCGVDDHNLLASLVPENGELNVAIEACTSCRGYVKTFTRLQGCAPGTVMLDDLASAPVDIAACEHGYLRPAGAGYSLNVTVTPGGAARHALW